jgi:RNA polymerase sigma factor (sigma-70 family)
MPDGARGARLSPWMTLRAWIKFLTQYLFISADEIPSAQAGRSELAKLVKDEIEKLPHDLKTAVLLFAYDNLSYDEIGAILGCTSKAVETRLYRVRKLLAKRLAAIF